MIRLYTQDSFLDSYKSLPENYRNETRDALVDFCASRRLSSLHPEKLRAFSTLYSLRIDRKYRILMNKINNRNYVLLFAGLHDDVYDFGTRNKKNLIAMSMAPEDYRKLEDVLPEFAIHEETSTEVNIELEKPDIKDLFAGYSDRNLMKGLTGPDELARARKCITKDDFNAARKQFTENSCHFLSLLLSGKSLEDSLHELFIKNQAIEEQYAFDQKMNEIRRNFQTTKKAIPFAPIQDNIGRYDILCGAYGSGKTMKIIDDLHEASKQVKEKEHILYLASNSEYLLDIRSYIQIVSETQDLEKVEILDYPGMLKRIVDKHRESWHIDFFVSDIQEDDFLLEMFIKSIEETDGLELDIESIMHDWVYVVENFGAFTEREYLLAPRLGCRPISNDERKKVWSAFEKFISFMKKSKRYSIGYAIYTLSPIIKRKLYKPYFAIFADDIHFLNYKEIDFLLLLSKTRPECTADDVLQLYIPYMHDLTVREFNEAHRYLGMKNNRLDSEKVAFVKSILPDNAKKIMNKKGVEFLSVPSCWPGDTDFEKQFCTLVRGLEHPWDSVIVAPNNDWSEYYSMLLGKNGINTVIVEDTQSYFDYLLDEGVRICTFHRLGCLTFENVIIPNTYMWLLTPMAEDEIEEPKRFWFFDEDENVHYKFFLFTHAVAASRSTTYLFEPGNDENMIQIFKKDRRR